MLEREKTLLARVVELSRENTRLRTENTQLTSNLSAARTASEVAAKHREALEQLVRDYSEWIPTYCDYHEAQKPLDELEQRKAQLLGEVQA